MGRRHLIAFIGLFLAAILVLTWEPAGEPLPRPEEAPAAAQTMVLRFGHNMAVESAMHQAAVRFAETVAERSGGRVAITIHPKQELGNDHEMVEMARGGELDIILTPTAKLSVPVPAMQYADMPFLFPSREDAYELLDGEVGDMLLERMSAIGLVGVSFWENGFKHFTANKPLLQPEDFQGLDIRVMKSRILMEQFRALGAHPVPIDFYATRKALADGVVDGQENPLIAIVSMGFHEVQSDLTTSEHGYLCYVLSFSEKVYEALPEDIQAILYDSGRELAAWERAETQKREELLLNTIREAGVTIHDLDEAAWRRFADRTAHIADQYEDVIGADIVSLSQEALYHKQAAALEPAPIVIGLDADLSVDGGLSGLAIKRGALLAVREINALGGVLGRPLKLIARDHRGMSPRGIANIQHFAGLESVVAVLGGLHSAVVSAELDAVHEHGIPLLLPWAAAAGLTENERVPNYVYRLSANDRLAAPFIIDHAMRGHSRPAILYENSVWGRGNLEYMRQHLAEQGNGFVYAEAINRGGEVDFSPILDQLEAAGADVIVMVLNPREGGALIEAMSGMHRPLPLMAHWGIVGGDTWARHRHAIAKLDLSIFQSFSFIDNPRPQVADFSARYISYFDLKSAREIKAPVGAAQAYDLVRLLAMAIEEAGGTERAAVRDALEALPAYQGVVRDYPQAFSAGRHDALGVEDYLMTHYADDGVLVPLP